MKMRFKTIRKEIEIIEYINSVREIETMTRNEQDTFIEELINDYKKYGFIKVLR